MPRGASVTECKAVLFDVDGTLVDSVVMIVNGLGDTFEKYLHYRPSDAEIRSLIGMPLRNQFALLFDPTLSEEQVLEMSAFALERFDHHRHHEKWFEPAILALESCRNAGLKTAIVTSKTAEELEEFLPTFPGTNLLDATVCASDVTQPKPNPESVYLACEKLEVMPSESAMVGDSIFDLRCARSAGAWSIGVAYGAAQRAVLEAEDPDYIFDTPEELRDWVRTTFLIPCVEKS